MLLQICIRYPAHVASLVVQILIINFGCEGDSIGDLPFVTSGRVTFQFVLN